MSLQLYLLSSGSYTMAMQSNIYVVVVVTCLVKNTSVWWISVLARNHQYSSMNIGAHDLYHILTLSLYLHHGQPTPG